MFEEQRQIIEEHLFEVHDLRRRIMEHLGNLQEKQRSLGLVQLHFENIIKTANN